MDVEGALCFLKTPFLKDNRSLSAFEYTALDSQGREVRGTSEGDSPRDVRNHLREQGLMPLSVEPVRTQRGQGLGHSPALFVVRGVRNEDISLATRQLATLVRAALPLEESLLAVSQQTDRKGLRSVLLAVRAGVLEGHAFAQALERFPGLFPDLYRETVAAGERSGQLEGVLERLADYLETSQKLRKNVSMAMIYPTIVMTFALLVTIALLTYVVPEVTRVFADFDQELPWLTRVLIVISDFLRTKGWMLLVGGAGVGILISLLMRRLWMRWWWHRFLLRLPLVSRLTRGINTARFTRTFGIVTGSGVPVLEGLHIASRVVVNLPMRRAVEVAADRVREGGGLFHALAESKLFSPMAIHLIASGESSGNLPEMLDRAATAQEQEVETLVTMLANLMEPLLILLMGGMVLTIVIAILLPVFDLNQMIQ